MKACASSGSMETLYRLVKLPAAHKIGTQKVLELLPAIVKGPAPRSLAGFGLKMITSLPAAQEVPSDTIAALLEDAIANKVHNVGALLQLPEARLLGAKYAIGMVPKAVEAGLGGVAVELGRFAHGLEPDTADIVNLLKIIVSSPWCRDDWNKDPMQLMLMRGDPVSGGYSFHRCLMDFCINSTGIILWDKLTGEDLLQLLEYSTSRGYTYAWHTLTSLPACVEITDAPRIIACFKAALQTATAAKDVEWPAHMPAVSRLRPSQFYDIMHCALQSPVHAVCESLLQAVCEQGQDVIGLAGAPRIGFPAAVAWPAGQLHELMCLAANVKDWRTVAALANCPAAQQVTPEALTVMLQQLLSSLGSDGPGRSEDESVAHAANLLQQMGAVLGDELRDVLGVGSAGSIRLASVHKEALLRLAALLPIMHVQPEQLPQADSLESQPIIWAGVMYITTRMPAARQWSVESVQQALERALRNVQPNPAAKTEHNANSLQLMVFSNLMKLPAQQMVSAASVQALLQHAQATGGVFKTPAVQNLLPSCQAMQKQLTS